MPDEPAAPAAPVVQPEVPSEPQTPPEDKTVPYDRFAAVNKQAKDAQAELKDLQSRLQELEDRDKSELERERTQREKLQVELRDRDSRLVKAERGGWVRAAAVGAKFIDPEDAVSLVDLADVESEKDAERAVKRVADRKKHLVQQEDKTPPIGRVLQGGQPIPGEAGVPPQDLEAEKFLEDLKQAAAEGWDSSPGLLDK